LQKLIQVHAALVHIFNFTWSFHVSWSGDSVI
jgi:hypothetical protein